MRYFIITYYQTPDGKYNETMHLEDKIKNRHLQEASVILDYKLQKIVKSRFTQDKAGMKPAADYDTLNDFYKKHYETTIKSLEAEHSPESAAS